ILGRRGGMSWDKNFDLLEDWRKWPIHAISGARTDGKVFTTARIQKPNVECQLTADGGVVRVAGMVPRGMLGQGKAIEGGLECTRAFTISPDALRVESKLRTTGQDNFAELRESIPVFLREGPVGPKNPAGTTIEFQRGKEPFAPATIDWVDG